MLANATLHIFTSVEMFTLSGCGVVDNNIRVYCTYMVTYLQLRSCGVLGWKVVVVVSLPPGSFLFRDEKFNVAAQRGAILSLRRSVFGSQFARSVIFNMAAK